MRTWVLFAVGFGLAAATAAGQAQHREAGAHEHGRGTLDIALEGSRLSMELEAPGADIVGFEHEAKTPQQKAAVEQAMTQLEAPAALFELPAAAECVLEAASVRLVGEGHTHGHDTEPHAGKQEHRYDKDGGHASFKVEYAFDCKAPANLTTIGFGYFEVFAGAQKLDVTVVTSKRQSRFEVSRAKPRIDLGGMM